ncbi:MAG: diguanylate cyclase domain-containing protein, partial [Gemmatimonadales bacterium]
MAQKQRTSWKKSELYDTLCLLMIAECIWLAGHHLHLFDSAGVYIVSYGLSDVVMFGFCMSFGIVAASVHKSLKLRRAMDARDAAEQEAASLARHDPLTGLANRRLLKETIEQTLRRAEVDQVHAVLVIDLDRFKLVNDLHGHAAGDRVLCEAADRLRSLLPKGAAAARLGGDEFAIFLPKVSGTDELMNFGEDIIAHLRTPAEWGQTLVEVGATVGVALYPA